ncbi:PadR family transcriptional regulator [Guptibacillus spartinae]|uniref:PadR family transcriptional regulator n=1 Tax=Guptibacillus spartinae TaxID=3025679 RepID=UPI002360B398|nr:PadR family transcriptional regulator [Pseudalkalibacillus spartinae]
MYELFILGELMDKPTHGYLLQYVLDKVIGPNRKLSWGVLYPLIQRLTDEGYVKQTIDEEGGRGRPKKMISLTDKGRFRFHQLMEESIPYDQTAEDTFDIKVSNFHHVRKEVQLVILDQFEGYLYFLLKHIDDNDTIITDNASISKQEKQSIQRVLQRRRKKLDAELNWVHDELQHIKEDLNHESDIT